MARAAQASAVLLMESSCFFNCLTFNDKQIERVVDANSEENTKARVIMRVGLVRHPKNAESSSLTTTSSSSRLTLFPSLFEIKLKFVDPVDGAVKYVLTSELRSFSPLLILCTAADLLLTDPSSCSTFWSNPDLMDGSISGWLCSPWLTMLTAAPVVGAVDRIVEDGIGKRKKDDDGDRLANRWGCKWWGVEWPLTGGLVHSNFRSREMRWKRWEKVSFLCEKNHWMDYEVQILLTFGQVVLQITREHWMCKFDLSGNLNAGNVVCITLVFRFSSLVSLKLGMITGSSVHLVERERDQNEERRKRGNKYEDETRKEDKYFLIVNTVPLWLPLITAV